VTRAWVLKTQLGRADEPRPRPPLSSLALSRPLNRSSGLLGDEPGEWVSVEELIDALLHTPRFFNGNTVRNFPTHGQLSAAQGNLYQLSQLLTLPY
jgi:hypothetical protein